MVTGPDDVITTKQVLLITGPAIMLLIGIVGFFLKRMLNEISTKLNDMVTIKICTEARENCSKVQKLIKEFEDKRTLEADSKLDSLCEGFDSLCRCLSKYTKGECP